MKEFVAASQAILRASSFLNSATGFCTDPAVMGAISGAAQELEKAALSINSGMEELEKKLTLIAKENDKS